MNRTAAPLTPPTAAALAAAAGMTREAFRVKVEWDGLLALTGRIADMESRAVSATTGRLDASASRALISMRKSRLEHLVALLGLGVPVEVLHSAV